MQLPRKSEHHKPGSDEEVPPMTIPWMQNEDEGPLWLINVPVYTYWANWSFMQANQSAIYADLSAILAGWIRSLGS